jgi:HupE / UreJ protein
MRFLRLAQLSGVLRAGKSRALFMRPAVLVALVLTLLGGGARAHQGGVSYAAITVHDTEVEIALEVAYQDWLPIVDLDADHDGVLGADEARAQLARLGAVARAQVRVMADGTPCPATPIDIDVGQRLDTAFTVLHLSYRCPLRIEELTVTCVLLAHEHPGHRTLTTVAGDRFPLRQHVFGPGSETLVVTRGRPLAGRVEAIAQFVRLGVAHIFTGYDHILFLLGLLLVASGLGDLLKIVTSFTIAHTLTLVLATLGYVRLDMRLSESLIALSIVYVAIENLVATQHPFRWMLTFGFGLVHGFGFSNVLAQMAIPRDVLGWSLASFNVGVELGQVVIVSLAYPLVAWSRQHAWNARAVRVASVAIGLMGLYWFVERALLTT